MLIPLVGAVATILLAAGAYLSWRLDRSVDWPRQILLYWPVLALFGLCSYGARFLRWHILVHRLAPYLAVHSSLRIYMAGFALGLTPGRLGELLKFTLLRDATGVGELESVGIFPIERASEAASFLGLALVGAVVGREQIGHVGVGTMLTIAVLPCLAVLTLVMRWLFFHRPVTDLAARRPWARIVGGLLTVGGGTALLSAFLCASIARSCDALLFFTAAKVVGVALPLSGAGAAWGLAGLVGGLSLLPAGVGAVEASLVTTVMGLGGDGAAALAAALLSRALTLWVWIPAGLAFALRGTRDLSVRDTGVTALEAAMVAHSEAVLVQPASRHPR